MIQVRGLTKVFPNGLTAVDGLDLTVAQGEIMGLLGPNGAGKTTTIRTLATLCGFDSGEVIVAGYDVDREPEKIRQSIGVVAQNTGIDYFLTGKENLELQGHLYRMKKPEIKLRIAELASYFELEDSLDRQVATYSGGMRRKLDIATALIHRPPLVFLDEPTLGLDIKSRKMLWTYIQKLNAETGLTILLTTHYLEEADRLAHRVAIISGGKIRALGTPDELKGNIAGDALTLHIEQQHWAAQQFVAALKQTDYVKDSLWEGNKLHLYVTNGAESVPKISELAGKHSAQILTLSLSRPSLDDVFLKYTGSSMDESSEESGDEWWKQWAGKGGGKWQQQWNQNQERTTDGNEQNTELQEKRWPQTGQQQDSPAAQPSEAAIPAGNNPPPNQWSAEEMAQWQDQRSIETGLDHDTTSSSPAHEDASAKARPQEQHDFNKNVTQWQNSQEDKKSATEDISAESASQNSSSNSWPDQQDWLNGSGDDKWTTDKKWSGNPSKK
jgi:ABC-2 type transport system ATP-binding protein